MPSQTLIAWPHTWLADEWEAHHYHAGATEPWTLQVVGALLIAAQGRSVLEIGTYKGHASTWLCSVLEGLGGGVYHGVEIDSHRATETHQRLSSLDIPNVRWSVTSANSLRFLEFAMPHRYDFAWVDGAHEAEVVAEELRWLAHKDRPEERRMKPGGIICMHDVDGPFGLDELARAYGGIALSFPKIHIAGGLGIIPVTDQRVL